MVAQAAVQAQRGFIRLRTHTHAHTHAKRHTQSPCVPCTPATRFHTPDSRTAGEHTHTKEQTDAVTLEMQAKRCRGEKFSLKLENSLFISAFGLQEEFCLFVRFSFFSSALCSFSFLSFFVRPSVVWVQLDLAELESLAPTRIKCSVVQSVRGSAP